MLSLPHRGAAAPGQGLADQGHYLSPSQHWCSRWVFGKDQDFLRFVVLLFPLQLLGARVLPGMEATGKRVFNR